MTDAFVALGLPPDADERAVKRAYARRLPAARPDADPEAFRALHAAYQAALQAALARARSRRDGPPAGGAQAAGAGPPRGDPAQRGADRGADRGAVAFRIDLGAFVAALLARAAGDAAADVAGDAEGAASPEALRAWIDGATSRWPIAAKPAVAPHLLACFDGADDPDGADEPGAALTPDQFDAVAAAFGLDDVHAGIDPLALRRVRARVRSRAARLSPRLSPALPAGARAPLPPVGLILLAVVGFGLTGLAGLPLAAPGGPSRSPELSREISRRLDVDARAAPLRRSGRDAPPAADDGVLRALRGEVDGLARRGRRPEARGACAGPDRAAAACAAEPDP